MQCLGLWSLYPCWQHDTAYNVLVVILTWSWGGTWNLTLTLTSVPVFSAVPSLRCVKMIKILITHMNNVEKNSFGIKIQREIESHSRVCIYIQNMLICCSMRFLNSIRKLPNNKSLNIYTERKASDKVS